MLEPRGLNLTLRPIHSEASGYGFRKQGQDAVLGEEEGEIDTQAQWAGFGNSSARENKALCASAFPEYSNNSTRASRHPSKGAVHTPAFHPALPSPPG